MEFLRRTLGLSAELPGDLRYQLLHRTASAVIEAKRFRANTAVMLVHSFNADNVGLQDFQAFVGLFGATGDLNQIVRLNTVGDLTLYACWVRDVKEPSTPV